MLKLFNQLNHQEHSTTWGHITHNVYDSLAAKCLKLPLGAGARRRGEAPPRRVGAGVWGRWSPLSEGSPQKNLAFKTHIRRFLRTSKRVFAQKFRPKFTKILALKIKIKKQKIKMLLAIRIMTSDSYNNRKERRGRCWMLHQLMSCPPSLNRRPKCQTQIWPLGWNRLLIEVRLGKVINRTKLTHDFGIIHTHRIFHNR